MQTRGGGGAISDTGEKEQEGLLRGQRSHNRVHAFQRNSVGKCSSAFLFRCRAVNGPPVCCIRMAEKVPPVMVAHLVNVENSDQRARCKAFQEFLE